jgi:vancomycin resistance protein VanJ
LEPKRTRSRRRRSRGPKSSSIQLPRLRFRRLIVSRQTLRLLAFLAWGYLALATLYATLLWVWGDAWWVATVLLFLPRWPMLLPAPLLALIVLPVRPRLLVPIALGALVTLGPAMGYRLGIRGWFTHRVTDLRLVTFNVDAGENPRVLALSLGLERYHPDVVVLQECSAEIAKPEFWPAGWTARFDQGICLAGRFPVLEARTLERVMTGDQGGTGSVMFYRLKTDSGTIDLGVIHLETPRKGLEQLRYAARISAMERNVLVRDVGSRRLSRWLAEQSDSLVVAGDFNMPVESTIYRANWSRCGNAFSRVGRGFGSTRVLPKYSIRIDHVLTCKGWRPLRAVVGPDLGSDHRPLIVDLARKR